MKLKKFNELIVALIILIAKKFNALIIPHKSAALKYFHQNCTQLIEDDCLFLLRVT